VPLLRNCQKTLLKTYKYETTAESNGFQSTCRNEVILQQPQIFSNYEKGKFSSWPEHQYENWNGDK